MVGVPNPAYIRCGAYGHAMFQYDNSEWTPTFGDPLTLRCERCTTERRDTLDIHGELAQRDYIHPADYNDWYPKGQRPSRAEFRRMAVALEKYERKTKTLRDMDERAQRTPRRRG